MPSHKVLKDMGVYDGDIEKIISIIGTDFETVDELKNRIKEKSTEFNNISVVSRYVLERLLIDK